MSQFPLTARLVEVLADLGEGCHPRYRFGSGCIVSGRTVLTAAHVVAGAVRVVVRDPNKVIHEVAVDPSFIGDVDGPDLALVEITGSAVDVPGMGLAAVNRDSASGDPVERCHAIGYPAFMEREVPGEGRFRETADAIGQVPVLSGLARGLLSVQVGSVPRPLPPEQTALGESEWSGMSGGPVVADGLLLGVVAEHAARQGPSAITATPLTALEAHSAHPGWGPGVSNPAAWWARLGVSGAEALVKLPPPRQRPEPAYWATAREIKQRTRMLIGREQELGEIASFASGTSGYLWLAGDMWAGKTSLLAHAVTALPEEIDVVSYFLSRREADADSLRFLAAVVPQLAYLLEEDPPTADVHQFRSLWQRAIQRSNAKSRYLLLVVDGLDEDLRPTGLLSVAALLPQTVGGRAHVLISSRLRFELPADLPVGHPLAHARRVEVKPFTGAQELAALARQEIDDVLRRDSDGLATDVLGLLTAAAGPLAVEDLAAMTVAVLPSAALNRRIRKLLTVEAARSFQRACLGRGIRYQFAHDSLLEYAQVNDDLNDPEFRRRIHQWADRWRAAGWPPAKSSEESTPGYLLDAYPSTLASEPQRLTELVGNIGWIEAAVRSVGVDQVLAELRRAAAANPASNTVAAMLAIITGQTYYLRPPKPVNQAGYVLRQLCLQACELSEDRLADQIRGRLESLPGPRLVPKWTTRRTSLSLSVDLGRTDNWVRAMAVLSDGRLVTSEGGRVLVRDPGIPGAPLTELGRYEAVMLAMALLPNGRIVTGGNDHRLLMWDIDATGAHSTELGRHNGDVLSVAVLPDGRVVTGGADGRVLVWDATAPGTVDAELDHGIDQAQAVAVLPDGRVVTGGSNGRVLVWDPNAVGPEVTELGRHNGWVRAVAVLLNGDVVTTGDDGRVLLWRPDNPGAAPTEIGSRSSRFEVIAVLFDGRIVTGGDDGRVLLWRPDNPGAAPTEIGRHGGWVSALAVVPDGRVVSSGHDYRLLVWDVSGTGAVLSDVVRDDAAVHAVVILPDGRVVTGMADGRVLVWDSTAPETDPIRLDRLGDQVDNMAILSDGRVVTGGKDGRVLVWDPDVPGIDPVEVGRHDGWIWAVGVLPDGRVVTTADERPTTGHPYEFQLLVFDPGAPGAAPVELGRQEGRPMVALTVLPDGRIVTGGRRLLVWDPAVPGCTPVELSPDFGALEMALLPNGCVITGGDDGRVMIWDPASPQTAAVEIGRHSGFVWAVATLPDDRVVTSGYEQMVVVRNVNQDGDDVIEVGSAVTILAAAFLSPETTHLVMAHQGAGFSVWSLTT